MVLSDPLVKYAGAPRLAEAFERRPILEYKELDKLGTTTPSPLSSEAIVDIVKNAYPDGDSLVIPT